MKESKLITMFDHIMNDKNCEFRRMLKMVASKHFPDHEFREYFNNFISDLLDAVEPIYFDDEVT